MDARSRSSWMIFALVLACGDGGGDPSSETGAAQTSAASESEGGSGDVSSSAAETQGTGTSVGTSAATSGVDSTGPGDTSVGSTGDTAGVVGLESLGTLVILGDSIGDGGGIAPYYYELLRADLQAYYGDIEYHRNAQSGSETDALLGQVNALPDALPGPIAVVITSGGNDMKSALGQIVMGTDADERMQMQANIDAAHDALLADGAFGAGVEVYVFEGNIYDASDGAGDFGQHDCAFGGGLPAIPSDGIFANWNGAIEETVLANGQTYVDMHAQFYGHGYSGDENWYAPDCTHPNALGHDQLRRLFYHRITGAMLP